MNESFSIQNLLNTVFFISKKYDDIAEVTGERYNIFQILKVQRNELSHSAFIADLLNYNGRHGLEDKFLIIFIRQLKDKFKDDSLVKKQLENFITTKSKVRLEHTIDNKDLLEESGRIDILIDDVKHKRIIIENKIDAIDQPLQLARYHHFDRQAPIFYITKEGTLPTEGSIIGSLGKNNYALKDAEHFVCLSYKDDIIKWLEECLKETTGLPLLRETLKQYIYLIKLITFQSTNKDMENDIINYVTKDSANIESAFLIASSFTKMKAKLVMDFAIQLKNAVELEPINIDVKYPANIGERWTLFEFTSKANSNYLVHLQFQEEFGKVRVNLVSTDKTLSNLASLNKIFSPIFKDINIGLIPSPGYYYQYGIFWLSQYDAVSNFFSQPKGWGEIPNGHLEIVEDITNTVKGIFQKLIENETIATTPQLNIN